MIVDGLTNENGIKPSYACVRASTRTDGENKPPIREWMERFGYVPTNVPSQISPRYYTFIDFPSTDQIGSFWGEVEVSFKRDQPPVCRVNSDFSSYLRPDLYMIWLPPTVITIPLLDRFGTFERAGVTEDELEVLLLGVTDSAFPHEHGPGVSARRLMFLADLGIGGKYGRYRLSHQAVLDDAGLRLLLKATWPESVECIFSGK